MPLKPKKAASGDPAVSFNKTLAMIPANVPLRIRAIALVIELVGDACCNDEVEGLSMVELYSDLISMHFPNIENLRLHIEEIENTYLKPDAFATMGTLPRLRKVTVDIHSVYDFDFLEDAEDFCVRLTDAIEGKAETLGSKVESFYILPPSHRCHGDMIFRQQIGGYDDDGEDDGEEGDGSDEDGDAEYDDDYY